MEDFTYLPGRQKLLRFDGDREARRQQRVEQLLDSMPQVQRADIYFDYHAATETHRQCESVRLFRLAQNRHGQPTVKTATPDRESDN